MRYDLVILDFDGTFTDVEKEGGPFFVAYKNDVEALLGADAEAAWQAALAKLDEDPAQYGWLYDGRIVAPGNADPYLRATTALNMILDARGLYPDPTARRELLQGLYDTNYPKAGTVFRVGAKSVVEALLASDVETVVVTNSDTEAVQAKIDVLGPDGRERLRVFGNARKYVVSELESVDARFDALPEEMFVAQLQRPILLRRGHYFEQLRHLWEELDTTPARTLVVGDIYELDLALPAALDAHVHLVLKDKTEPFEIAAVEALPHGEVSDGLDEVLVRVGLASP